MICFQVSLNGKVVCAAGVPDGMLNLFLTSFSEDNSIILDVEGTSSEPKASDLAPKLRAALQHPEPRRVKQEKWIVHQRLNAGDEITVRIMDRQECDPPI